MNTNNLFCLVGIGQHANNIVMPALNNVSCLLVGIVSKKKLTKSNIKQYKTLGSALKNVPKKTIFILCTPPHLHFKQAKKIIDSNFDVIIEKPAFLSTNEFSKITNLSSKKNNFIFEVMMYRETLLFKEFLKIWKKYKKKVKQINISFVIPNFPKNTFRDKNVKYPIVLFDIGCYLVDILNFLKLKLKIKKFKVNIGKSCKEEIFQISYLNKNIDINLTFGVGSVYKNSMKLNLENKISYTFKPFFYGRSHEKQIIKNFRNKKSLTLIEDFNAFESIYSKNFDILRRSQKIRNITMSKNLAELELIWKKYKDNY